MANDVGNSGNNFVYLPVWVKVIAFIVLLSSVVLGFASLIDSATTQVVFETPNAPLAFLQFTIPSLFAFAVIAFGRRYVPSKQIEKRVVKFLRYELPQEFDTQFNTKVIRDQPKLRLRKLAMSSDRRGCEYAFGDGAQMGWVNIWFDLSDFHVLFRLPHSSSESIDQYAAHVNEVLRHWLPRFERKGWELSIRPSVGAQSEDGTGDVLEVWAVKKQSQQWIYDPFEQTVTRQEVGSMARSFFQEIGRGKLRWNVDAPWLASRRIIAYR